MKHTTNYLKLINYLERLRLILKLRLQGLFSGPKSFLNRCRRVIDFLPIVWNGHDYDYVYSVELFKYQLQRQERVFRQNSWRQDAPQVASRIRTAIELIDKVYGDVYVNEIYDNFERLYGPSSFHFEESANGYGEYIGTKWAKAVDEKNNETINQLLSQMLAHAYAKQERAHDILWRFIAHNFRTWWD